VSDPRPEWMTVKEVADMLRFDPQTVWRKIQREELPGVVRFGRQIRIRRDSLLVLFEDLDK
jgi:excisionase family DNA binding protein